jgi:hypothetical protein
MADTPQAKHNEYTFPFSTCEKPQKDQLIAQPYSVLVNCIAIIITIYFLTKTTNTHSFILVFSILIFQFIHQFSHAVHIEGRIQTYVMHFTVIILNFLFINMLYHFTKIFPSISFILYVIIILIFDIYALFNLSFLYYFSSQILLFVSTFIYYKQWMPPFFTNMTPYIVGSILVLLVVLGNEVTNCKSMLSWYPDFPFHIMVEICGYFVLYFILSVIYRC